MKSMAAGREESYSWHNISSSKVLGEVESSERGLLWEEAKRRLEKYGLNQISEGKKKSLIVLFFEQFNNFLVYLLIFALVIDLAVNLREYFLGGGSLFYELLEPIVIFAILILNAGLGFFQEVKVAKTLELLKKLSTSSCKVRRDGHVVEVSSREIVRGDIIILESGDKVPADLRVLKSFSLKVDESMLTGESSNVDKEDLILDEKTLLAERRNMMYMNTIITNGSGEGVVVGSGEGTEVGKIAGLLRGEDKVTTPLEGAMEKFGKNIGIAVLGICAVVLVLGILREHVGFLDMMITAISLAVAAVPEGLPAVVTITLSFGMRVLAKNKSLARKLSAVETLGSTTVIVTDKTGTLTKNDMEVQRVVLANNVLDAGKISKNNKDVLDLLISGSLCNNAEVFVDREGGFKKTGDSTETAILVLANKVGIELDKLSKDDERIAEISFNSERKMMSTVNKVGKEYYLFSKGAPEVLIKKCKRVLVKGKEGVLTPKLRKYFLEQNEKLATSGLRVLGISRLKLKGNIKGKKFTDSDECNLTFLGLVAMVDPPRDEVRGAVLEAMAAGIRVIMVTGDNPKTAAFIAKEVGIEFERVVLGGEVDEMSQNELERLVMQKPLFARVSPTHKYRIVEALQNHGEVTAMTGDGVNDAPALKKAEIGIAMGIRGTDISKEAADMVLVDDNFATIVVAVREGRRIFSNIKKISQYLLSSNMGEVILIFLGILLGLPLPLLALQILWVNLLTDGLPALALTVEGAEKGIMSKKFFGRKRVLDKNAVSSIFVVGGVIGVGTLILFWLFRNNLIYARSVALLSIVLFEGYNVFNARTTKSVFSDNLFKNLYLLGSVVLSIGLVLLIFYVPILSSAFGVVAVGMNDWLLLLGVGASVILAEEVRKVVISRNGV